MEKGKVNIIDLCDFLLTYLIKNQISVNHLKLQKVLYYTQAWHLVYFDDFIFDEQPEAWVNGPVYRSVYEHFKELGTYNDINLVNNPQNDIETIFKEKSDKLSLSNHQRDFLASILTHYGTMSHDKLVMLTHSELPWNEAREGLDPFTYSDRKINFDTMKRYYKERLNQKMSRR